ncbi:swarming motility protein YbiA [Listeria monocytogenes]|nr:swarming motility protein YbiA [Listeria monocytogenes]GAT40179.1 swarming motility protein YbiA [Listeria monocytogenes]
MVKSISFTSECCATFALIAFNITSSFILSQPFRSGKSLFLPNFAASIGFFVLITFLIIFLSINFCAWK